MNQPTLFELPEEPKSDRPDRPLGKGKPRLRCANRQQVVYRAAALDDLLPDDHPARSIWQYIDGLDFGPIHEQIRSIEGHAGRRPADPRILLALWLFATSEGVGSARQLNKLCTVHAAYRWMCGDVPTTRRRPTSDSRRLGSVRLASASSACKMPSINGSRSARKSRRRIATRRASARPILMPE